MSMALSTYGSKKRAKRVLKSNPPETDIWDDMFSVQLAEKQPEQIAMTMSPSFERSKRKRRRAPLTDFSSKPPKNMFMVLMESQNKKKIRRSEAAAAEQKYEAMPKSRNSSHNQGLEQVYLSVGQKYSGSITCPTCKMIFYPGQASDEKMHSLFHKKFIRGVSFPGWKDEKVVVRFSDGSRITVFDCNSPARHLEKLSEAMELINMDLGGIPNGGCPCSDSEKVYLYITGRKVVGGVVCQRIQSACSIFDVPELLGTPSPVRRKRLSTSLTPSRLSSPSSPLPSPSLASCSSPSSVSPTTSRNPVSSPSSPPVSLSSSSSSSSSSAAAEPSLQRYKAVIGVDKIWVHGGWRRKGIATRLMNSIRETFVYGYVVPKSQCAFSQPTHEGRQFAAYYTSIPGFLTYK